MRVIAKPRPRCSETSCFQQTSYSNSQAEQQNIKLHVARVLGTPKQPCKHVVTFCLITDLASLPQNAKFMDAVDHGFCRLADKEICLTF